MIGRFLDFLIGFAEMVLSPSPSKVPFAEVLAYNPEGSTEARSGKLTRRWCAVCNWNELVDGLCLTCDLTPTNWTFPHDWVDA